MASTNQPKPCRLLALPAELRNNIYRLALCRPKEITLGDTGWIAHGSLHTRHLLSTCSQIRSEASSIYYLENTFSIWVIGFNPSAVLAFEAAAKQHVAVAKIKFRVVTRMSFVGSKYSWAGLMRWLKAYYDGEVEAFQNNSQPEIRSSAEDFAEAAFEMVGRLREQGKEWKGVEKALMELKREVKGTKRAVRWRKMGM